MVTETKPVEVNKQPAPSEKKMIPLADLIAFKEGSLGREKKLKDELAKNKEQIAQLEAEREISGLNIEDDEDVKVVKKHLLEEDKRLRAERAKIEKDLTSLKEREKEVRARQLVYELNDKGVKIDYESLLNEEDMELKVHQLYVDYLAKENEDLKKKVESPESVYETGSRAVVKKQVKDMTAEELKVWEKEQKDKYYGRK